MVEVNYSVHSDPNKLIGKTFSHYAIQEVLGSGGMGVVYRAEDTHLHRPVALKFLSPAISEDTRSKERFLAEAQAASALDHPNICTIYEFGETDTGRLFIAMACYAGESLKTKLDRGPLSSDDALDYGIQIARGLAAAHGADIVHRDIKPANVIVTDDGVAKIVDFGIARVGDAHLTQTGATTGTTGYMSPEQTRGNEVDGRTDIWALGALLYESLTGVHPFQREYDAATVYAILHEDPEPMMSLNPDVSSNFEVFVERCLQKSPAMRYQTVAELVADLDAVQRGEEPKSSPGSSRSKRPRTSILVGAAVALLVVIAGLFALTQNRGGGSSPGSALAEAVPGIAILPFSVQGQDLDETMREGMVSLLSTGLDGVAGLRTISPGTVFARWRERVSGEEMPDLSTQLEIARETGASYALVGSAIEFGSATRLVADVYDVATSDRLGQARSEGSSEEFLPLVDRLGVEVLSAILQKGEEELPELDLASLTTNSPDALMAYLEGEVHYRRFDIPAAREAYTRAVVADSTFALAHSRLSMAFAWPPENPSRRALHCVRGAQLSDRLPAREALLVNAARAELLRDSGELDALRQAVQTYPDDAEIWYRLAETLLHVRSTSTPAEEIVATFERAVQLDPGNARYLVHYVDFAFTVDADSQEAARRLEMFERASSEQNPLARAGRIALALAFGDSAAQASAMARLETEDVDVVMATSTILTNPEHRQNLAVNRLLIQRMDNGPSARFAINLAYYGRFRDLLEQLEDPRMDSGTRAYRLHWFFGLGFPVPAEVLDEAMESIAFDSSASGLQLYAAGRYAADEARWADHSRAIAEFERRANSALAASDSLAANRLTQGAKSLRGYALWITDGPEAALAMMGDLSDASRTWERWWWQGQLYQELERFRDAERIYLTYSSPSGYSPMSLHPLAHRELGRVYEALEEYDKAREAYAYFVEYWNDADAELQPMVQEARRALIRLQEM